MKEIELSHIPSAHAQNTRVKILVNLLTYYISIKICATEAKMKRLENFSENFRISAFMKKLSVVLQLVLAHAQIERCH